jgi:hypothetical protein
MDIGYNIIEDPLGGPSPTKAINNGAITYIMHYTSILSNN